MRVVAGLVLGVVVGVVGSAGVASLAASSKRVAPVAEAAAFLPSCPHLSYGVDGTIAPLFCKIDNPAAIAYYKPRFPHLFALGPNASPEQVDAAMKRDRGSIPTTCSAYVLWQWRWHWHFAVDPVDEYAGFAHSCYD